MKKFVLLLVICVLGIQVFAGDIDEAQVPKVVKECVKQEYPEVKKIKWDLRKMRMSTRRSLNQ